MRSGAFFRSFHLGRSFTAGALTEVIESKDFWSSVETIGACVKKVNGCWYIAQGVLRSSGI